MVKSMTGYGNAVYQSDHYTISIEMKAVNHRFCEINIRMPKQLLSLEEKIKREINKHVHRGRIEVFITLEGQGLTKRQLEVDWDLLKQYIAKTGEISEAFGLQNTISLKDLLQVEDIFIIHEMESTHPEFGDRLLSLIETATNKLVNMRVNEGEVLQNDIELQLADLEKATLEIMEYAPRVIQTYREKLEKRMQDLVRDAIDDQRIATEVAIFADRSDINEELQRIQSHIYQFKRTLSMDEPIGRKLDFLIQELNREINTIGSKGNDAKIANCVINMKACLEKMKEQVQNIE